MLIPVLLSPLLLPTQSDPSVPLPFPTAVITGVDSVEFGEQFRVRAESPELEAHSAVLADAVHALTGARAVEGPAAFTLSLAIGDTVPEAMRGDEAYQLRVDAEGIRIEGATPRAVAWGSATLLQLIEPHPGRAGGTLSHVVVLDAPEAEYRSLSIDVARQPHSIAVLEDAIRLAWLCKIRYVQLHLTDDQHFTFPFEPVVSKLEGNHAYTRQELVDLVAYAEARGVTLIPEIDLPGHSTRLIRSGYLPEAKSHADVAHERHAGRIHALLDDVMEVFAPSPYLHVGGDESGAGSMLVPFLARANRHVRSKGKRLIVWEGFHGAPTDALPPTGDDRILVASWESSYNAPWDLLAAGYEIVNASWRPLYVVGGASRIHPGSTGGRMWPPEELAAWSKDRFMHWEPGRPVFEDRGPGDDDATDSTWDVRKPEWRERVLGGQVSVWEQNEASLLRDLRRRLPVVAERLWSKVRVDSSRVLRSAETFDQRMWGLVQPASIEVGPSLEGPARSIAHFYDGDGIDVRFRGRTRRAGEVRWTVEAVGPSYGWIEGVKHAPPAAGSTESSTRVTGAATIRAQFHDEDGRAVGAGTWARVIDWPPRVRVTNYDLGKRADAPVFTDDGAIDLGRAAPDRVTSRHELPMMRGPLRHERAQGQRMEATLVAPRTGRLEIAMKTQSGRATLWLDLDRSGTFEPEERLIRLTPTSEERIRAPVDLVEGRDYALRIDHVTGQPRPVLIVTLDEVGAERPRDVTEHLSPL